MKSILKKSTPKLFVSLLCLIILMGGVVVMGQQKTYAVPPPDSTTTGTSTDPTATPDPYYTQPDPNTIKDEAKNCNGDNSKGGNLEECLQKNPITVILQDAVRLLSAIVGLVILGSIIVGGLQYSSARDNPQQVSAAKTRLVNSVIALGAFIFMFAFLQWLVPGGIF